MLAFGYVLTYLHFPISCWSQIDPVLRVGIDLGSNLSNLIIVGPENR